MDLLTQIDYEEIGQAMDDIWDTIGLQMTVVKEPTNTVTNFSGTYIPGFGLAATPADVQPQPTSQTFPCIHVDKTPDNIINPVTTKLEAKQDLLLKVKQDCRDFIQDGRKNLHVIFLGRKYRITTDEQASHIGNRTYWIFKLEYTR